MEPSLPLNVPKRLTPHHSFPKFSNHTTSVHYLWFTQIFGAHFVQSMYDKNLGGEFQSEIQALSKVEHLNLVKCYGYLEHEDERIVVVEYVPNGTLREHLECELIRLKSSSILATQLSNTLISGFNGNVLSLDSRLDIAIDVAHAITYLHTYTGFFFFFFFPNY